MSLRHVVLVLLSKQPNTGYGVGRLLACRLAHLWSARLQQIYSELARLEGEGLVRVELTPLLNRPAKKTYALTTAGYDALDRWLARPCVPAPLKSELLVKLYCLERLPPGELLRRLEDERDRAERAVQELRQQVVDARRTGAEGLGHTLTLDAGLCHAEAHASWCERALSVVRELGAASAEPRPLYLRASRTQASYGTGGT